MPDDWEHLYEVSIETLELSETALASLRRLGVTSVGDCLDHFSRYGSVTISVPFGSLKIMETEVLDKLVQHGYMSPEQAEKYRWQSD
ncbi:MAG: hypothetical protein ABI835_12445 [Chloroflexota bacterium]